MSVQIDKIYLTLRFFLVLVFSHLLSTQSSFGQVGVFIGASDSSHIFESDSAGVFQNVLAEGTLGSESGADLIFLGETWQNNASARFPGEGRFTFEQPSSLGLDVNQKLGGVNWDNRFPNMILRNSNDLNLIGLAGNRDTFDFDTGCVIHDLNDFVIGESSSGTILDYGPTKYFITNHTNLSDSGFLIRHGVSTSQVDFPVGNAKNDYTPARLVNNGAVDTFSVRVFPNVYELGNSGSLVQDITVNRTWNILENTAGGSSVDLTLQHNAPTEGAAYTRASQYVARYFGQPNNAYRDSSLGRLWDYAAASNGYSNSAGSITTGPAVGFEATRSQSITTAFSASAATRYFTKGSTSTPVPVTLVHLSARWQDDDALISWSTATEINNKHFIVYRSYDNFEWEPVDEVSSKAPNGNSFELLNYELLDTEVDEGRSVIYYKLEQFDYDGKSESFGPVRLEGDKVRIDLSVTAFPNPTKSNIFLNFEGEFFADMDLEVIDVLGQIVANQSVSKQMYLQTEELNLSEISSGHYWVRIRIKSPGAKYIEPIKILIVR